MEIILIQDVDNLGGANELVKVKNGYARNYLIPGKMAVEASPSNIKQLEEKLKQLKKKEDKMLAEISSVISKLTESPLKLTAKTGTSGKIFGSITPLQISRAIRDQKGYEIDRRKNTITDEVKENGSYKAHIHFGKGKNAEEDFEVVGEEVEKKKKLKPLYPGRFFLFYSPDSYNI
jgi:large subunit ribosomal protein L9